ncbi:MAG TPA: glycerophosphodiester phosphodiesterase, partial [Chroococcales cyanobacterium]
GDLPYAVGDYAHRVGASAWNPGFGDFREDSVKNAHQAGLKVNVWTVNQPKDWQEMLDWQVDGIFTDDPQGLKGYLENFKK